MSLASRILVAGLISALAGCAGLPAGVDRPPSSAYVDTGDTRLGRAFAGAVAAHPGKTGVLPLLSGRDAFAARMIIARAAERSLDVQYYIWHADTTGNLMFEALWQAAERGVRVRLLLDDQNTRGLDPTLAALDSHPNIEVRLFNPFASRAFRIGDYTHSFARLNRRMHNKSFTADNQVAIVGGRNIGDEYFEAGTAVAFADLDTVVEGAVVRDVSAQFDAYWNSASAYPLASLVPAADAAARQRCARRWSRLSASPEAAEYIDAVRETALVQQLVAGTLELEWVSARLVSDDPDKVLHPPERREMQMGPRLQAAMGRPSSEMDLVSPYFVPTQEGTDALVAIAARGVKVRVLTNSLAATDVAPVYAGYVKYREALLRGGVRLFELKPQSDERPHGKFRRRLRGEPAREDLRDRPQPHLHRLVQSRSALGPAQHGSGRRPGKPDAGDAAVGGLRRQHSEPRLRSAPDGRRARASNGSSRPPRAKCAIRRRPAPAPRACSSSTCCGSCRSSGCSSGGHRAPHPKVQLPASMVAAITRPR